MSGKRANLKVQGFSAETVVVCCWMELWNEGTNLWGTMGLGDGPLSCGAAPRTTQLSRNFL